MPNPSEPVAPSPRWGDHARDRKALAIWLTLTRTFGVGVANGNWLDVGCGSGGIAAALAPRVAQITAVDPEPWEAWVESTAAHRNLMFLTATFDQDTPPVPDCSADMVLCNQVYEHVSSPPMLLRNIHRVLKPGGRCYLAGPNLLWPVEPHVHWPVVHWLPRATAQGLMRVCGSRQADALDAFSANYWALAGWIRAAGFSFLNGIPERACVELELRGASNAAAMLGRVPDIIFSLAAPFSPGFIFLLKKQ